MLNRFQTYHPDRGSLERYIQQSARNIWVEKDVRPATLEFSSLPADLPQQAATAEEELASREMERHLVRVMAELPRDQHDALELHLQGIPYAEIAARLDITLKAAYLRLFKARQLLVERLEIALPPTNRGPAEGTACRFRSNLLPRSPDPGEINMADQKNSLIADLLARLHLREAERQLGIEPLERRDECPQPTDLMLAALGETTPQATSQVEKHVRTGCHYCQLGFQSFKSFIAEILCPHWQRISRSPLGRWIVKRPSLSVALSGDGRHCADRVE